MLVSLLTTTAPLPSAPTYRPSLPVAPGPLHFKITHLGVDYSQQNHDWQESTKNGRFYIWVIL